MSSAPWGHVAEWLRNGLQNRVHQFDSGRGLHQFNQGLALIIGEVEASPPRRRRETSAGDEKSRAGDESLARISAGGVPAFRKRNERPGQLAVGDPAEHARTFYKQWPCY
jgi:hypothetical protein